MMSRAGRVIARPPLKTPVLRLGETMAKQPEDWVLPDNIGFHIRILQLRMFREFKRVFRGTGLTPAILTLLVMIRDRPGIRQRTLADLLMVQPSNIAAMIGGLDDNGLVSRSVDTADRRACRMRLTRRGRQLLDQNRDRMEAFEEGLLAGLDAGERTALRGYLDHILRMID
ncbi:MAG: MarR family winged helix-turn-helix transcriptional regulator [Caulobacteraceae bacterium]